MVGAWSWFVQTPAKAINSQLTVWFTDEFGAARYGIPSSDGEIYIAGVLGDTNPQDDHSNPCAPIRRDSDGRYLSFWTGHNYPSMYMSVSINPDSVSNFSDPVDIASQIGYEFYSYPNPVQLLGETNDPIYLFFRAAEDESQTNWGPYYSKSIDGGSTWDEATRYVAGVRPYILLAQNGDNRVDFIASTGNPAQATTSLYHFYMTGGSFYTTGGSPLSLPIDLSTLTPFWNASTEGVEGWQWQIKIDGSGHPRVVFSTFPDADTDHRYYYARWTGSVWVVNQICTAGGAMGHAYYSGGICIDPDNLSVVYASRKIDDEFHIWRFVTSDNGATWDSGTKLTTGTDGFYRPHCVSGASEPRLVVMTGVYTAYTDFDTRMKAISSVV